MGTIRAICISEKRGTPKKNVSQAVLRANHGIEGDAHAGDWHRQVSFLSAEKIEDFKSQGAPVEDGSFGENIIADGIDFASLHPGDRISCGDALLEVTQIGKECHDHCQIYYTMGSCIMPTNGVFARVLTGGTIAPGDPVQVVSRPYRASVITLSDKGSKGEREDKSGPMLKQRLEDLGYEVGDVILLPDDITLLKTTLCRLADEERVDLVLTTGSTGFSPRDIAPEATISVAERNAPGIAEAIRAASMRITPRAMLSRGQSVIRKSTLIVNLPGSVKGASESLDAFIETIPHGLDVLRNKSVDCGG